MQRSGEGVTVHGKLEGQHCIQNEVREARSTNATFTSGQTRSQLWQSKGLAASDVFPFGSNLTLIIGEQLATIGRESVLDTITTFNECAAVRITWILEAHRPHHAPARRLDYSFLHYTPQAHGNHVTSGTLSELMTFIASIASCIGLLPAVSYESSEPSSSKESAISSAIPASSSQASAMLHRRMPQNCPGSVLGSVALKSQPCSPSSCWQAAHAEAQPSLVKRAETSQELHYSCWSVPSHANDTDLLGILMKVQKQQSSGLRRTT